MFKKVCYTILVFFIFLLVAESISRQVESRVSQVAEVSCEASWQMRFFGSILGWHEPDSRLLWRHKKNLSCGLLQTNDQHYLGEQVPEIKEAGKYRILLLGDSSPVGLGLERREQAFGERLKYMLGVAEYDRREIELVNMSVSGYSSAQLEILFKNEGLALDPDLVLLYCGNNDASLSGSMSDRELLDSQRLTTVREQLSQLAIYRLIRDLVHSFRPEETVAAKDLKLRVSPEEFGENIAKIISRCTANELPLIIIKPPVPLLWPAGLQVKPFAVMTDSLGQALLPKALREQLGEDILYCFDREIWEEIHPQLDPFAKLVIESVDLAELTEPAKLEHNKREADRLPENPAKLNNIGVIQYRTGSFEKAAKSLKEALLADAKSGLTNSPAALAARSPILFNLGIVYLSQAESWEKELADTLSLARIYLDSALQADYLSLRIKQPYLAQLEQFKNIEQVTLVDLSELFLANGGERLFVDHCHPTAAGHLLIAEELLRVISEENLVQ